MALLKDTQDAKKPRRVHTSLHARARESPADADSRVMRIHRVGMVNQAESHTHIYGE